MHSKLFYLSLTLGAAAAGAGFVACKSRTEISAQDRLDADVDAEGLRGLRGLRGSNADVSETSSSDPALALWYERDTRGENSGSPDSASGGGVAVLPAMKDNVGASGGFSQSDGEGGQRPDGSGDKGVSDQLGQVCLAAGGDGDERLQSLLCTPVPQPTKTDIVDKSAAIRLGKAFFWDIQVGGDGKTACASCHFSGGGDNRLTNTVHPGINDIFESLGVNGPGQSAAKFLAISTDDRVGSQGISGSTFIGVNPDPSIAADSCKPDQTKPFLGNRRVTGRNTPSVIGAVFNRFNFWDGRANVEFNGFDPFGATGNAINKKVLFTNGGLASQAVGPANNSTEMSCDGRKFNGVNSLASKMLARRPLQFQRVAPSDSVLGELSAYPGKGLNCYGRPCSYGTMIRDAFGAEWVPLAEANFSRLWGQAVQAYEATLIPDQTRFDQYMGGKATMLSPRQLIGLGVFAGSGNCASCHKGAELTDASFNTSRRGFREGQGNDEGFHNLGVRPTEEDLGRANAGPLGATWSMSKNKYDRGAFKTPGLRNLKLTAPYFHNGGKATLEEVVAFYAHRGGDFPNPELTHELQEINIESSADQTALVDFLRDGLLDCRVDKQRAPFDHPEIVLPNGPTLGATGMAGLGSCRLDPAVPPTTVNCIRNPVSCESNAALHGTSVSMDLRGRFPSAAEVKVFTTNSLLGPSPTIRAMLTSKENLVYEFRRVVETMLGRRLDAAMVAQPPQTIGAMVRAVGASQEYFTRCGGTNTLFLKQLMLDLSGRVPNAGELAAAQQIIARSGRGGAVDYLFTMPGSRNKRVNDIYWRFLRRDADPTGATNFTKINNETEYTVSLLLSVEYKAFAAARDDM